MPQAKKIIPAGSKFGRLTVIEECEIPGSNKVHFLCECACGHTIAVRGTQLRLGKTSSCGCLKRELMSKLYLLKGKPVSRLKPGVRIGRLMITKFSHRDEKRKCDAFECLCDCGKTLIVRARQIYRGMKSCGCLHKENIAAFNRSTKRKHNLSHTPEYRAWRSMRVRCSSPNCPSFRHYGGRGITVCDRWMNSFESFIKDMGLRPDGKSLDRIDNNGNYEPGNCRWATLETQANNKRPKLRIEEFSDSDLLAEVRRRGLFG